MMKNSRAIFVVMAFLLLVLLAFFLVWRAIWGEKTEISLSDKSFYKETPSPTPRIFRGTAGFPRQNAPKTETKSATLRANPPVGAVDPLAGALDPDVIVDTISPLLPVLPDASSPNIVENLFPKKYIESLARTQDAFIQAGWLKAEEKAALSTESGIQKFLERAVEVLIAHNGYPSKEYAQSARNAASQFPKLWAEERRLMRAVPTGFLPPSLYRQKRADILDGLLSAIFPKEANAQVSDWLDDFVTIPDCWKSKDRLNYSGGSNLFAFCCNCGMLIIPPYVYKFYWDCGPEDDSSCNVPMGCLNAVCAGEYNAIFDGPPGYKVRATAGWGGGTNINYSFTCGCDASSDTAL